MLNFFFSFLLLKLFIFKSVNFYENAFFFFYFKPFLQIFYFFFIFFLFFFRKSAFLFLTPFNFFTFFSLKVQNDLFTNSIFFVHPNTINALLLSLMLSLFYLKKRIFYLYLFIFFLGMFWSFQEVFWNGIWDWNILELSNLIIVTISIFYFHFFKNFFWKNYIFLLFGLIVFFFNNFLNIKSVHSFFFLPISKYSCTVKILVLFFFFTKSGVFSFILLLIFFFKHFNFFFLQNIFFFNKCFFFLYVTFFFLLKKVFFFLNVYSFFYFQQIYFTLYFYKNISHFLIKISNTFFIFLNNKQFYFVFLKKLKLKLTYVFIKCNFYNTSCSFFFLKKKNNFIFFFMLKINLLRSKFLSKRKDIFFLKEKVTVFHVFFKKNIKQHNGFYFFKRQNLSVIQIGKNSELFKRCKSLKGHPFKNLVF